MTKAEYKAAFESELAELNAAIAAFDMSHSSINGFIANDAKLRSMRKRAASIENLFASGIFN